MEEPRSRTAVWPEFLRVWADLLEASHDPSTTIVVEGERDRRSLHRLGVRGRVVTLHRGRPLGALAHELSSASRRVVVLTDWDAEGGRLAQRLREFLDATPVELDLEIRRRMARWLRGELTHVEGLYGWARRTAEELQTPIDQVLRELEDEARPRSHAPTG